MTRDVPTSRRPPRDVKTFTREPLRAREAARAKPRRSTNVLRRSALRRSGGEKPNRLGEDEAENPKTQKPKNVDPRASTGRGASRGQFLRLPSCARRRRRAEYRRSAPRGPSSWRFVVDGSARRELIFFHASFVPGTVGIAPPRPDASLFEPRARPRFRDTMRSNVPIAFYSARAEGAECCDASALAKQNTTSYTSPRNLVSSLKSNKRIASRAPQIRPARRGRDAREAAREVRAARVERA